ncbi:GlxA family transcriptional regulator [Roseinatronobacter monicus]|uniref:AraC family transcriptional regulator with amidase-like domain n=1 Tax=Roseinatronobacter monicus TaxID=393481 RepID=A0A543K3W2_9RHOB|nr:GlxA family transcriptional regulator [Roseinatronobacter monicus]TQM89761.1 AraC family transcriptional regulator with amidase-like domain [Roseinatronobacter monicus]
MATLSTPRASLHPIDAPHQQFIFLLLDRFSLLAYSAAIEPLRLANRVAGNRLYSWKLISETGDAVTCSNGTQVSATAGLGDICNDAMIVVCGGVDVQRATTPAILSWLRKRARHGNTIAGICTAAWALAKAGLLDGHRATIHWENHNALTESFPEIELNKSVFVISRKRLTAAGGTAPLDMMLTVITNARGADLAHAVADQLIYSSIRTNSDTQRLSIPIRIGVRNSKLARVIELMENHIEDPVSPSYLASEVDISTRQLERLFRRYLSRSPKRYYMELRLERARHLLLQTDMSVINVAIATGFTAPSHFSKCYRAQYQTTPYRERAAHGTETEAEAALQSA